MEYDVPTQADNAILTFDVVNVRAAFPILHQQVHGKPLAYLDSAATSQKPTCVIEAIDDYYRRYNSNVHRGVHKLAEEATHEYEQARVKIARFIGSPSHTQIVYTRGTTESINLVASAWGDANVGEGDEVLVTHMEHHSNIVPWQMLCKRTGATLVVAPIDKTGTLVMDAFERQLTERTKVVAVAHVSNALGTINPIERIIELAHGVGAVVVVDGAQAVPHMQVNVEALDADFYAFSGHKMCGPTGIGVLYGKADRLEAMGPYQGGGDMIKSVTFKHTEYNDVPYRFEAGTPNIVGGIGLGVAVDYLTGVGMDKIAAYEHELLEYGTAALQQIDGLRLIGTADRKAGVLSFVLDGIHPYDMAPILDRQGVAVRTGHHCAQPVMDFFGVPATARASLAFYNTRAEIDQLFVALKKAKEMLA
ncbi:MAG: SufS family cysteine desulfurase [Phycisphaera sp.]|nr:SufS family cysteine desulfurase [Phycisphaera sp.]